jgi:hypothetical protein
MHFVVTERLRLGGKTTFRDLYGRSGGYEPAMGPHMKAQQCPICSSTIEKLTLGGGCVFICPGCQPDKNEGQRGTESAVCTSRPRFCFASLSVWLARTERALSSAVGSRIVVSELVVGS